MHLHANHSLRDMNEMYEKIDHGMSYDSEVSAIDGTLSQL